MEMTQRRGIVWDAHADKLNPDDVFQIRRSGLLLSLSILIQIFALLIFIAIPSMFSFDLFWPYAGYIVLFTVFCGGILQLIVLLTGMNSMTSLFGSGKALLWLSVIALMVATACIPISLLVFQGGPVWFVLGLTIPPSSLSNDFVFHLWYSIYLGSLAIYSFGFGYMLIRNHDRFNYGNLIAPGVFLLIQATFQVVNTVLANIALLPPYYFLSLKILLSIFGIFFSIFVTVVWFPYVGYQFRKLVYSGPGDGWDQFRQRLRENPTVQSFLARRMFGIIAMILSLIVTIEIMINSLLHISPYARFWWLALIGLLFGFVSLKFEHPNGYAITALCLGSLCWVAGSFLYSWSYYFL